MVSPSPISSRSFPLTQIRVILLDIKRTIRFLLDHHNCLNPQQIQATQKNPVHMLALVHYFFVPYDVCKKLNPLKDFQVGLHNWVDQVEAQTNLHLRSQYKIACFILRGYLQAKLKEDVSLSTHCSTNPAVIPSICCFVSLSDKSWERKKKSFIFMFLNLKQQTIL